MWKEDNFSLITWKSMMLYALNAAIAGIVSCSTSSSTGSGLHNEKPIKMSFPSLLEQLYHFVHKIGIQHFLNWYSSSYLALSHFLKLECSKWFLTARPNFAFLINIPSIPSLPRNYQIHIRALHLITDLPHDAPC